MSANWWNKIVQTPLMFLAIGLSGFLLSCAGSRHLATRELRDCAELRAYYGQAFPAWRSYSCSASTDLTYEKEAAEGRISDALAFTIRIRMVRDSAIWLHFSKLGIEGARCLILPDSFCLLNRIDNTWQAGRLKDLLLEYGVDLDFRKLQDLLAGRPLLFDTCLHPSNGGKTDWRLEELPLESFLRLGKDALPAEQSLRHPQAGASLLLSWLELAREKHGSVHPRHVRWKAQTPTDEYFLDLTFHDMEFDQVRTLPFEVPSHYTRLP